MVGRSRPLVVGYRLADTGQGGDQVDRTATISLGDVDLFVREIAPDGSRSLPLVVVHGGPDWDHAYLLPGLELIAGHRHLILFDLRGCGQSSRGLGYEGYQPEIVVEDIARLIEALGHDRVDLLGFSTGGQVAQLFVESHPHVVRRLVLASTTAYPEVDQYLDGWEEYTSRLGISAAWPSWAGFERGQGTEDVQATIQWAIDAAPTAIWDLDRLDEYVRLLGQVQFTGEWIGPFREGRLHPWRPANPGQVLRDFDGQTLILHGAQDMSFPVQVAQRLHCAVPGTKLAVIERAGHMTHFDQPEIWANTVLDFLNP